MLVNNDRSPLTVSSPQELRRAFQSLIRRFGLLDPDRTPCGHSLTVSHAHALMELLNGPGLRQLDLARTLGLSKSAVCRMVEQLEQRGWILRQADEQDGRACRLRLSVRGAELARRIDADSLARFADILDHVPAARRREVIAALELLQGAIPAAARTSPAARRARRIGVSS